MEQIAVVYLCAPLGPAAAHHFQPAVAGGGIVVAGGCGVSAGNQHGAHGDVIFPGVLLCEYYQIVGGLIYLYIVRTLYHAQIRYILHQLAVFIVSLPFPLGEEACGPGPGPVKPILHTADGLCATQCHAVGADIVALAAAAYPAALLRGLISGIVRPLLAALLGGGKFMVGGRFYDISIGPVLREHVAEAPGPGLVLYVPVRLAAQHII